MNDDIESNFGLGFEDATVEHFGLIPLKDLLNLVSLSGLNIKLDIARTHRDSFSLGLGGEEGRLGPNLVGSAAGGSRKG